MTPEHQHDLRQWILRACITERFASVPLHVLRAIWRELAASLGLKSGEQARKRSKKLPVVRECRRFNAAWARSRVMGVLLASRAPERSDGQPLADPCRVLAAHGPEAIPMLLSPRAPGLPPHLWPTSTNFRLMEVLQHPANRIVCDPSDALGLRSALCHPGAAPHLLESHCISPEAHRHLVEGNLMLFLGERRRRILSEETRWLQKWGLEKSVRVETGKDLSQGL